MPNHRWGEIRGLGNRLRHGYDQVNFTTLWNIVSDELPSLKTDALAALERLQSEDPA